MKRESDDVRILSSSGAIRTATVAFGRFILASARPYILILCAIAFMIQGCGNSDESPRYQAEKALFKARKLREDLASGTIKEPFLERAIESFRDVVAEYRDDMHEVEGLEEIVVSAQMDLAELEFRTSRYQDSRKDFEEAITLAEGVPPARANAIYSCGVISEEIHEAESAISYYERFVREYFAEDNFTETASWNREYLIVPLTLSKLYGGLGKANEAARWLQQAQVLYSMLIEATDSEAVRKGARFNLLTAYLEGKKWRRSIEHIEELTRLYAGGPDIPGLLFIEAMVTDSGFGKSSEAIDQYEKIQQTYPDSREAPRALLAAADIHKRDGRYEEALALYRTVAQRYRNATAETVQAEWQIAEILAAQGKWSEASLKYKEIYQNYPTTEQGLKAPLALIENYLEKNERDAARAAYEQALQHYERLISSQVPPLVKVLAESHIVTAHGKMGRWEDAAASLLQLPDKYPRYPRFWGNYLMAASIYEKELKSPDRAIEALEQCMERYPGTALAAEAEKQYTRLTKNR
jgi:tetratricopeptide (TPR) repeat protein